MSKSSLFSLFSVAALSLGLAGAAPVVTISSGMFSTQAGVTNTAFDVNPAPGFTFTGNSGIVTGSETNSYAAPTADTTAYAFVGAGGLITYNPGNSFTYLGLYWGSPDTYNTLTLTYVDGTTAVVTLPAADYNSSSAVYANITDTNPIKSASFASSLAAFEFDNVSSNAAPEPASLALIAGGLLAIGAGAIRRRKA